MVNEGMNPRPDDPIPGTEPDTQLSFLYVETFEGETVLQHLRKVSKCYREALKSGDIGRPKDGMMGTTMWLLETPSGQKFIGLSVGGDREGWLRALRKCLQSMGRASGEVIGYHRIPPRFTIDGGATFQLSECRTRKLEE